MCFLIRCKVIWFAIVALNSISNSSSLTNRVQNPIRLIPVRTSQNIMIIHMKLALTYEAIVLFDATAYTHANRKHHADYRPDELVSNKIRLVFSEMRKP